MKRPGSISSSVAALLLVALLPLAVSAQYTEEDRKQAIDAVASFFDDMGDSETAKAWRSGWERGIYTFETLDGGTWASVEPPGDHPNFFGIISVKAEAWRLGKDGNRVGAPAGFADKKGQSVLGYGYPRGNQPKSTLTMTVSRTFDAGAREGDRMAICVTAQGVSEMVQTEYIYEWKTP